MSLATSLAYRRAKQTDVAWIKKTWIRNYYRNSPIVKMVEASIYGAGQDAIVNRLLDVSYVTVACSPSNEDDLVGFLVKAIKAPALHYVYVSKQARREGIAKRLIGEMARPWYYSHLTDVGKLVASKLGGTYDPFLLLK